MRKNIRFIVLILLFSAIIFSPLTAGASMKEDLSKSLSEVLKEDIYDLNWTRVEEGQFVFYYYLGSIDDIYLVRKAYKNALPKMKSYFRSDFDDLINVVIFPNEKSIQKYIKPPYDRMGFSGFSFPEEMIVIIPLSGEEAPSDFIAVHELTHLVFRKALIPNKPSLWLDEGIASYFGSNYIISPYRISIPAEMKSISLSNSFIPLGELIETNDLDGKSVEYIDMFYLETFSFIEFFNQKFGESKFQLMMDSLKAGSSEEGALKYSTEMEVGELDVSWRSYLSGMSEDDVIKMFSRIEELEEEKKKSVSPERTIIYVYIVTSLMMIVGVVMSFLIRNYLTE